MKSRVHLLAMLSLLIVVLAAASFSVFLVPVVCIMGLIVLWPLRRKKRIWFVGDVESEYAIISRRREESLRAMKDLEEEHMAGKVSKDEYDKRRPEYLETARDLTLKLDEAAERRKLARGKIDKESSA